MKRPSIGDVARHAGVSTATVSRALNAPDAVTEKTRRKVQEAVDELHYVQSETARNFKLQRANAVLVVAHDVGSIYYSELFRGIQRRAQSSNFTVSITNPSPGGTQDLILSNLRTAKVDGVILLSGHRISADDFALMKKLYAGTPPVVALGEERGNLKIPQLLIDNEHAGYIAGRHLIEMGHTLIGHTYASHNTPVRRARANGLRRALTEAGLPIRPEFFFECGFEAGLGRNAARAFLSLPQRPTAVFCANDLAAMGFMSEVHKHGLSIPEDVSILGFDDIVLADSYIPALSTIHQPRDEIGRRAMNLLLDIIEKRNTDPIPTVEVPVHLIPRDSIKRIAR
ncbi:LacI family DNA-binding transcriptional regulator [Pelagibacterium sediminicola]|uniref:LacI family DNA-binding transcriptional regulator n=1 Tax=Pelagibacterium sediminicola TaxID=2248761 RepID=UPI000E3107CD|nr:LacI family DNA-binding transcriptional regulator [Pelagibacterium sediminicola]